MNDQRNERKGKRAHDVKSKNSTRRATTGNYKPRQQNTEYSQTGGQTNLDCEHCGVHIPHQ